MKSIKRTINDIRRWGFFIPKNQRVDTMFIDKISSITGFKANDIELNIAKRSNSNASRDFTYFEFNYHKKNYKLTNNILEKI